MKTLDRAAARAHARTAAFRRRLGEAEYTIGRLLRHAERPYVAFSTGKDSTVCLDLVWSVAPTTPAVYFDADCAYWESRALLWRLAAAGRPIHLHPTRPFLDLLADAGGPDADGVENATMEGTVYAPIRTLLATHGFDGAVVGLRADESPGRRKLVRQRGQLFWHHRDQLWEALPIAHWSDVDVWAYLVSRDVDYNHEYDCLAADRLVRIRDRRVSYWAGETNRHRGRWVHLRQYHPALFATFAARFPEVARLT